MKFHLPLIMGLFMLSPLRAATPLSIEAPDTVAVNAPPAAVIFRGLPTDPLDAAAWSFRVFPEATATISPITRLRGSAAFLFTATQPARYTVLLDHAEADSLTSVTCVILATGSPDPDPDPDPDPNPPTPVEEGERWYVLIYESATDGPSIAPLINSQMLRDTLETEGHHWLAFDRNTIDSTDQAPAHLQPYILRAADRTPFLMLTTKTGRVLWEGTPPATPDEVLELVPLANQDPPNAQ